ncbi:Endoglucanase 5 [Nymphaea thermarum]|nr:Endoglucanase 5 [Nymphaea thermarum]
MYLGLAAALTLERNAGRQIARGLHDMMPDSPEVNMGKQSHRLPLSCCCLLLLACSMCFTQVVAGFDYADALGKTFLFFEAQRSGKLPANQRVKWRGDSGLQDGFQQGVNLVGGYYDAGDHVKYGFPMAFTVTILSWSVAEYAKELGATSQLDYALDAIRWGTDYFIKAHSEPYALWAQVGDGGTDHYCWERPEGMTTPRTAYKIDSNKPDQFRGSYDDSVPVVKDFYPSTSGYLDELLWSAAWLFRATGDGYYMNYVINNAVEMGGTQIAVTEFSWDNKYAGLQILLSKVLMEGQGGSYVPTLKQYQDKAAYFLCACLQKNGGYNVRLTPGGLLYWREWNNMQYVAVASFLVAVYSGYLNSTNTQLSCPDGQLYSLDLLKFAESQADYILGKNPRSMSYFVGYGNNFPTHVHHRGASITSMAELASPVGCTEGFEEWFNRAGNDPNVLVGALVGGPDKNDNYVDQRWEYDQSEATTYNTAPLVGLFAKLYGAVQQPAGQPF